MALGAAFAALAAAGTAYAGEGEHALRVPLLPKYQQECAACHVAYPPGLLPAASWQRVMDNLPRHYGTDASLDPATLKELSGLARRQRRQLQAGARGAPARPHHPLGVVRAQARRSAGASPGSCPP